MVNIYRPESLAQALDTLSMGELMLFSGGTDLMVQHGVRAGMSPKFEQDVLFVDAIEELQYITVSDHEGATNDKASDAGQALYIGAGVVLSDIEQHALVPSVLRQSVAKIAAPALRNRATLAGNICNASPAADSLPALYLLDARVVLSSMRGQREMRLEDFILAPRVTALKPDEMLTHIVIPQLDLPEVFYHKVGTRAANALSKLSVAGLARIKRFPKKAPVLEDWRVAFGAVGPTVVRSRELESLVIGQSLDTLAKPGFIAQVTDCYREIIHPIDDQRSTSAYRQQASINLLTRWLEGLSKS
ncbi:FAD binding domain-containing protein [Photobacterium sp. ZSDE20]|uniref:FAD binding domain-containing protein n=1 Tax=Photobacterium pectinilyticum TaxID=2906793 RepID=A0ABT1MZZ9_9GAMM|nr:FAD binding domain-containing protein [Photobacterium sp. ZSDE20]MCQ1057979.1 FAD binding domain-containing protein [Photobacterium sp. ZSDE20]MDD1822511.1 FAD binding domain-containing protein [Photobacterium sp. ZSDE20]